MTSSDAETFLGMDLSTQKVTLILRHNLFYYMQ